MPALQRGAAWAEARLLGALRQSVPQNGRIHLHIIDFRSLIGCPNRSSNRTRRNPDGRCISYRWEVHLIQIGGVCRFSQEIPAAERQTFAKVHKMRITGVFHTFLEESLARVTETPLNHDLAPKSQIATATIFLRKLRRKNAFFAQSSRHQITFASDGHSHM